MNRNRRLLLLGLCFLGSLAPVVALGDLRDHVGALLALWGAAHAIYLVAARLVMRPERGAFGIVLGVAVTARLLILPVAPTLSEDVYRYLWDGRLVAHGVNPYPHAPSDPALAPYHDALLGRLNHAEVPTIYPPAAQILFAAAAKVDPTPLAWKAILLVLEAGLWIALLAMLRRRGLPAERVLLYAWNPLVIVESYGSGHLDLAAAALLVIALALDEVRRPAAAGVAFAVSTLCKYTPLLLVPTLIRRRSFALLAVAVLAGGLLFVPFAGAGHSLWSGLVIYVRHWEFNGSLFPILRHALDSKAAAKWILAAALGLFTLVVAWRARSTPGAVAALYAGYLIASPTVFPWYVVPLVALLPLVPEAGIFAFSGLVALSYLSISSLRDAGVWSLPPWVPWMEYGGAAAASVAALVLRRRGRNSGAEPAG